MFVQKLNHICTIPDVSSKSFLPPLSRNANVFTKIKRFIKKLILVTENNPRTFEFFRNNVEIVQERKRQVASGSWIIHPFSTFRLYYEMWMAVIFLLCMIYMPLESSFKYIMKTDVRGLDLFLCISCMVDIGLNFRTGYCVQMEYIEMRPGAIAKNYVCGIYFICDVISSIPELKLHDQALEIVEYIDYCSMFKIVRIGTCLEYVKRTLIYFKTRRFVFLVTKLTVLLFLVTHYVSCILFFLPILFEHIKSHKRAGQSKRFRDKFNNTFSDFISAYLQNSFVSASLILGVEIEAKYDDPWITYLFGMFVYFFGKLIMSAIIVIIVDVMGIRNCLEIKYFAMMSQIDSFMSVNQFPLPLRKKMKEFYSYKYRQKYFNEDRIERFISDKLRKEIKYHACRKMVHSVKIFETLPQEILEDILTYLKQEIYMRRDVVAQAGAPGDCMYFLASGTVAVSSPSGKEICHLVDGDYFGEICLLIPKQTRIATVVALETCEIYNLDRKSFRKCLQTNSQLYKEIQLQAKRRYFSAKEIERMFIKTFSQPHLE
ncbi:hypothetical protein MTP99_018105 [Tenebrio molitor]|nr:hypothetical protein MTP99_018105 [Tenebrio molitor]CAH1376699.1 unnamed protein product [Tenebrio molitor]